jgi:hypothetical protein
MVAVSGFPNIVADNPFIPDMIALRAFVPQLALLTLGATGTLKAWSDGLLFSLCSNFYSWDSSAGNLCHPRSASGSLGLQRQPCKGEHAQSNSSEELLFVVTL